jgi:hypothetical protein
VKRDSLVRTRSATLGGSATLEEAKEGEKWRGEVSKVVGGS